MNRKYAIPVVLMLLLAMACGTNMAHQRQRDDRRLEADVRNKIVEVAPNTAAAVEISVNRAVVTLTGRAPSEEDRRRIGDAANSVRGVRSVINNITTQ